MDPYIFPLYCKTLIRELQMYSGQFKNEQFSKQSFFKKDFYPKGKRLNVFENFLFISDKSLNTFITNKILLPAGELFFISLLI